MAKKLSLDTDALSALLMGVNTDGMSDEQKKSIESLSNQVLEAQKSEKVEKALTVYNDALLENAKLIADSLPTSIPDCMDVIRLVYDYDTEKGTFVPNTIINTQQAFPGVLTDSFLHFRAFLLDGANKEMIKHVTDSLNAAGKQAHGIDDYSIQIDQYLDWKEIEPSVKETLSDATGAQIMGDISLNEDMLETITKGSVVILYNSAKMLNLASGAENEAKVNSGSWGVTIAGFNKATKYTKKSTSNGTKTSASDWIPDSMDAKNAREYLLEAFGDDDKLLKAITKHTTNDVMDWTKVNATQHIIRCEQDAPEANRYYTNFKSTS